MTFNGLIAGIVNSLGTILCIGFFAFIFLGLPIISAIQGQRRKLQYIPPRIGIEGHGIKRGLTAVEAGILMEEPLDKVLTMILFGVVKKGAASVASRDPLKVTVTDPLPDGLHDYETGFVNAFKIDDVRARQTALQNMMVALVKSVSEKMKGFSRKETQDYYKNIMEQAWAQVESAQTPEVKGQAIDQNLEWTMLDRNYDDRSRRVFTGPIFIPMWWGNYDPTYRTMPTALGSAGSVPGASVGRGSSSLPGADLCRFDGRRRTDFLRQGDRRLEHVHQQGHQRYQSPASTFDQQLSRRRWQRMRLCLCLCRLRLCLRRWRQVVKLDNKSL